MSIYFPRVFPRVFPLCLRQDMAPGDSERFAAHEESGWLYLILVHTLHGVTARASLRTRSPAAGAGSGSPSHQSFSPSYRRYS